MGQRYAYYYRIDHALRSPHRIFSLIMDGMQQDHCMLPHRGNKKVFDKRLPQHIQGIIICLFVFTYNFIILTIASLCYEGVLIHGYGLFLYRTFHNIGSSRNLAIQTFLMSSAWMEDPRITTRLS